MGFGLAVGAHLVQHRPHPAARELPSRLASGQAAPDDMNFACHH